MTITGLLPAKTYYYSVESVACCGFGVASGAFGGSFTTPNLDIIPPTVTINPIPAYNKVCPMTISGTANDTAPGKVTGVTFTIDGTPITPTYVPSVPAGSTTWTVTIPCGQLTGTPNHTVTAVSHDGTNDSLPANASFVFDNVIPTITIIASPVVIVPTVAANGVANDNDQVATVEIKVNSGPRVNVPIAPGAVVNWSVASLALIPGPNTIIVYAIDRANNEGSASTVVTYNVPTFTVTPFPPTTFSGFAGDTFSYFLDIASVNGFADNISFTSAGAPGGSTTTFTTNPLPLGAGQVIRISMIVVTLVTGPTGSFTIIATGSNPGGTITDTGTVQLTLAAAPDFTLSHAPNSISVVGGFPATFQITAAANSTFVGPAVTFALSGQPLGVTGSFVPSSLPLAANLALSTNLALTTTPLTPAGPHVLTITGTSGPLVRTTQVTLIISAPPDITFTVAPPSQTVTAGGSTFYNATVTAINGFTEPITISTTAALAGLSFTYGANGFVPAAAPGTPLIITAATTGLTPAGTHPITFTAANVAGTVTKSVTVDLVVNADTIPPIITNVIATPSDVDVDISWTTNEDANSRFDLYADAAYTIPIGFRDNLGTYCLVACHFLSYGPALTPLTTYYFSVTSKDLAGNSATLGNAGTPLQFTTTAAPDLTPPSIAITAPANGTTIIGTTTITSVGDDNNPMKQIFLKITPQGAAVPLIDTQFTCSANPCTFNFSWNTLSGFPNGKYELTARAESSVGPANLSGWVMIVVTVDNPPAPQIVCLPGQVNCEPEAININCGGGVCSATIHWKTDTASTSEVDFNQTVTCGAPSLQPSGLLLPCSYLYNKRYDDTAPPDAGANYTEHFVTLTNLQADKLYHYRVTSCNIINLCTN